LHAETALGTGRMTSTFECSKKWGDYLVSTGAIDANGEEHLNCRYILRDSIGRFQTSSDYRNGLGFEYNSVTGAVTRNFD
ncbi:hypothetical protein ACK369_19765, partial [Aeromonas veronii]